MHVRGGFFIINWSSDEFKEDMMNKWMRWIAEIENLTALTNPRYYFRNIFDDEEIQLHVFCHSSAPTYACVVYLRITKKKSLENCFVMAKSRVRPLKQ